MLITIKKCTRLSYLSKRKLSQKRKVFWWCRKSCPYLKQHKNRFVYAGWRNSKKHLRICLGYFSNFPKLVLLEGTTNRKEIVCVSKEHNKHERAVKFRFRGVLTSCYYPWCNELLKNATKIVKHQPERMQIQADLYLAPCKWNIACWNLVQWKTENRVCSI